jgi:hypothetical protein
MVNRHNNTQTNRRFDLVHYFNNPTTQRQKQYEVVRALVLEKQSMDVVATKFGYKISTIYSLLRDAKAGKIELFPVIRKGPQQKRTSSNVQNKIIVYRRQGFSTTDIHFHLAEAGIRDFCRIECPSKTYLYEYIFLSLFGNATDGFAKQSCFHFQRKVFGFLQWRLYKSGFSLNTTLW